MTTIDIKDWKGNELHKIMGDYVKNVHHNATKSREWLAVQSGDMLENTYIKPSSDGFTIDTWADTLPNKRFYYPYKYSFRGYTNKPARDFLMHGVDITPFGAKSNKHNTSVDSWVNSGTRPRLIGRLLK